MSSLASPRLIELPPAPRKLSALKADLLAVLGKYVEGDILESNGELTLVCAAKDYLLVCQHLLHDAPFKFSICLDLCGVDYSIYANAGPAHEFLPKKNPLLPFRFAVVLHLLSIHHNQRLRLRVFCGDDNFPSLPSIAQLWTAAAWYEREAFDLFGIVFSGHPDLRRLLTDYGFIGHPFRKDFPISGHVEMRYDPEQKRVIYQPVSIAPREVTPRVIREPHYAQPPTAKSSATNPKG